MATGKLGHKETGAPMLANVPAAYASKLKVIMHSYAHVMQSLHIGSQSHWLNTYEFSKNCLKINCLGIESILLPASFCKLYQCLCNTKKCEALVLCQTHGHSHRLKSRLSEDAIKLNHMVSYCCTSIAQPVVDNHCNSGV